jgi:hypothetical protein
MGFQSIAATTRFHSAVAGVLNYPLAWYFAEPIAFNRLAKVNA